VKLGKRIIFVGGGSAGHVLPLLSVARKIKQKKERLNFFYFGSGNIFEQKEVTSERIKYFKVLSGKWRRNLTVAIFIRNVFDLFKVILGFFQSVYLLVKIRPDLILSKGGFVSVPVVFAAGLMRVPLIIHESDTCLGLANKISLKFSLKIATAFPLFFYSKEVQRKGFYAGVPLREQFVDNRYKVSSDYILFTGGSLGSERLNEIFYSVGQQLLKKHEVVHLTGRRGYDKANLYRESLPKNLRSRYTILDYSQDMAKLISSAKLVISRAGASSIFEIASFSKKAILIPIDEEVAFHQLYNARLLKKAGLSEVFMQDEKPEKLLGLVEKTLQGGYNLTPLSFKLSADLIAGEVLDLLERESFLSRVHKVFMIGTSGVSMRGVKYLFERLGKTVVGSDIKAGGHSSNNITKDLDLVVYSSAITKKSPGYVEIKEATEKNIPILKRSQAIGSLMKGKNTIAVSGMHGKTTISLLLARIFETDGRSPTYLVGAPYTKSNPSYELGNGGDFIVEACEYDDSFLDMIENVAVISNIEEEHLDYFRGGISQIKSHFVSFCKNIKPGGALVYCSDDANVCAVVREAKKLISDYNISFYSYGFREGADFRISRYGWLSDGLASFCIKFKGSSHEVISQIAGEHFALNATAAMAVCLHCNIDTETTLSAIANFEGAKRRMEFVARRGDISFYDDYAHHPTEISATTRAFEQMFPKSRKVLIYEPHQQERFDYLYKGFLNSFKNSKFDQVGILPVFAVAGRDARRGKSSQDLVRELKEFGSKYYFLENYDHAVKFLNENLKKSDIVVTMGATDVYKIIDKYLEGRKYYE
jgi:UDP-N-acetylmuramate--alanine ligase